MRLWRLLLRCEHHGHYHHQCLKVEVYFRAQVVQCHFSSPLMVLHESRKTIINLSHGRGRRLYISPILLHIDLATDLVTLHDLQGCSSHSHSSPFKKTLQELPQYFSCLAFVDSSLSILNSVYLSLFDSSFKKCSHTLLCYLVYEAVHLSIFISFRGV